MLGQSPPRAILPPEISRIIIPFVKGSICLASNCCAAVAGKLYRANAFTLHSPNPSECVPLVPLAGRAMRMHSGKDSVRVLVGDLLRGTVSFGTLADNASPRLLCVVAVAGCFTIKRLAVNC